VKKIRKYFRLISPSEAGTTPEFIQVHSHSMPIVYRRHGRARNYVLRLQADKTVVVTVPRGGSREFAREFVASRAAWLEKQWRVLESRKIPPQVLRPGMEIFFRGRAVALEVYKQGESWQLQFGGEQVGLATPAENLRPPLEEHLRGIAQRELVFRAKQLAQDCAAAVRRVVVRNQKSRWGSCSYNGTISLNWRLIQLPAHVCDYIIIHELMHLRHLNHSAHFWAEVERACPDYRAAEDWLKENSGQVGF
jgi:predicted metal-dependent hydrolase